MFVARQARPSRIRSTTVISDFPSLPVENGETIDASASESARPACAARKPPQSLPPSPHMPVTRLRLWKYFTTLILSSGFIRAKTTIRVQICASSSGWLCKCLQAPCVTAIWHSSWSGPSGWAGIAAASSSMSGFLQAMPPAGASSPNSTGRLRETMLHCLPIERPVRALSPVQMTDRIAPFLKSLMACRESLFISFLKSRSPQMWSPDSSESLVRSATSCGAIPAGKLLVAMPRT
mmetsp:Transcript_82712/g.252799  ORF Transcript_82712/g.252799 Transcript_82712/m.252799 type:complete len:236 (+) Transcript_82712:44-751(+)